MTLGGWILFAIIAAAIAGVAVFVSVDSCEKKTSIVAAIVAVVLIAAVLGGMLAYYKRTESGKRAVKSWKSEIEGGISRTVRVYDVNGELIQEYSGRFDVKYDDNRIIFDDQDGRRHVIYYPTGTVIIDENEGPEKTDE